MGADEDNFETIEIEGQLWAVTPGNEGSDVLLTDNVPPEPDASEDVDTVEASEETSNDITDDSVDNIDAGINLSESSDADNSRESDRGDVEDESETEFDPLRALTELLLGGAIEGTSQLVARLQKYEEELRAQDAESNVAEQGSDSVPVEENELDRLRFAFVGLVLDAQSAFKRNVSLWARIADRSIKTTNRVASPVTNSFLFGPMQRRYDRLVQRGERSLAKWVADGRKSEPHSRELAKMTYKAIVDEFINQLAENPELEALVAQQGIGLASEARDEVRERTVTADNVVESLVRRILRRTPRAELPPPPPEVQRWANMTLEDFKVETRPEDTNS